MNDDNDSGTVTSTIASRIVIKDSGVYKFSRTDTEMVRTSAAGSYDFNPTDFNDARNRR